MPWPALRYLPPELGGSGYSSSTSISFVQCLSHSKDTPSLSPALVEASERRKPPPIHDVRRRQCSLLDFSYSLAFASRGANVVVNDLNGEAAQKVVDEIVKGVFSALVGLD